MLETDAPINSLSISTLAVEEFELFLKRKTCGDVTRKLYLMYLGKIFEIMDATRTDLNQEIVDGFLDAYPHAVGRAFLRNYLEFRHRQDLTIQKKTGTQSRKEVENIPDNELMGIRKALYEHDERYGLLFDVSEGCALRRQEALNIKRGDMRIEKNDDGTPIMFIRLKKTKGERERSVVVPNEVAVKLLHFIGLDMPNDRYIFRSNADPTRTLDKTMWNKAFTKASLKATGKKYHPHQLRHSRSLKWFDKGIDIVSIQRRLGHSSIATTQIYINPDKLKELEKWSKEDE